MRARSLLYGGGQWLSCGVPEPMVWQLADWLCDSWWRRATAQREAVAHNLRLALGAPVPVDSPLVRDVYRNFGRHMVEFFRMPRVPQITLHIEGRHYLEAMRVRGEGAILLSAHFGSWELLGAVVVKQLGLPVTAVALPHDDARINDFFNGQRARCGIEVIQLGPHATSECLTALRRGRFLGLIGDQNFGRSGICVRLFGGEAVLPRGPAVLSLRARRPLVPIFMIREGWWRFRLMIEAPIWPPKGRAPTEAVRIATQRFAEVFERQIRSAPTQWLLLKPFEAWEPDASVPRRLTEHARAA